MPTDRKQQRIDVLLGWREVARADGHLLPSASDLVKIGAAGSCDVPHVDSGAVLAWRHTLEFLITQVDLGVHDPVEQMTDDMRTPRGGTPAGPAEDTGGVLVALRRWRSATERTDPRVRGLKEHHLRRIARDELRLAGEIAAFLPADVRRYAEDLARVVADASSTGAAAPEEDTNGGAPAASPTDLWWQRTGEHPGPNGAGAEAPTGPTPSGGPPSGPAPRAAPPPVEPETTGEHGTAFARFDHAESSREPIGIEVSVGTDDAVELRWDPAPGTWVVYRVIASDRVLPFTPDFDDDRNDDDLYLVQAGRGTVATDTRPFTASQRHVTVWVHSAADRGSALATPPVLHAAASFVAPVVDAEVVEDEGRVVGRWVKLPGTDHVGVERVRMDRGRHDAGTARQTVAAHADGFVDDQVEPGATYRYQIRAEVRGAGGAAERSQARVFVIDITAALDPVSDLVLHDTGNGFFDVSWTAPRLGTVEVYRTADPPIGGRRGELLKESALDAAGLPPPARLGNARPPRQDGRSGMAGVAWPAGWSRLYLTPVTAHRGRHRIGTTITDIRTAAPLAPRILERVDHQVLTVEWPPGAASLHVHQGDPATGGTLIAECTAEDYRGLGGLRFAGRLEPQGCTLFLRAVSWNDKRAVFSETVPVPYPGLYRVLYALEVRSGVLGRDSRTVHVSLAAEMPVSGLEFALVHDPLALPLAIGDGTQLPVVEEASGRQLWRIGGQLGPRYTGGWFARLPAQPGWVRLFVDLPSAVHADIAAGRCPGVAVQDPAPGSLWIHPAAGR